MSIFSKKAAMVMYAIEQELGLYVLKKWTKDDVDNIKIATDIRMREFQKGNIISKAEEIVSASYISELLDLCLFVSNNTTDLPHLKEIKALFTNFSLYDIRNSIAHPNKAFPEFYWYRVAAVGCDPIFDKINITDLKAQVRMAEDGSIADPPEDWLKRKVLLIPNNVPLIFDHEVTGLVGRAKEKKQLLKSINNPRQNFYALVAPGGTGKTALALDVLSDICSDPAYINVLQAIIFISLKTEELTASGVRKITVVKSISEIQREIVDGCNSLFEDVDSTEFSQIIDSCYNKKILLCIDNLETILIEQSDFLENFIGDLPPNWKVLVTSRIAVQTAQSIALEPLDDTSAKQLIRVYNARQGNAELQEVNVEKISNNCFRNPLAIRLAIDSICLGKPITDAIHFSKTSVLEFSFSNLIGVLDKNQVMALETIFVITNPTRFDIIDASELSHEEVSHALNSLCKTSLVVRGSNTGEDEERYKINDSLRELLIYRVEHLKTRNEIIQRINNRKVHAKEINHTQKEKGICSFNIYYIPSNLSENLQIVLSYVLNITRYRKQASYAEAYKKIAHIEQTYKNDPYYWRVFAYLVGALGDRDGCISKYQKSLELNPTDPVTKFMLARYLFEMKDYAGSEIIYQDIKNDGWWDIEKSTDFFTRGVCAGYFLSILYQNKYESVLDQTKKWKDAGSLRGLLGTFRASAYKRSVEVTLTYDIANSCQILIKAIRILADVFRNDGYYRMAASEARKVIDEVVYLIEKDKIQDESLLKEWVVFLDEHLESVLSVTTKGHIGLSEYVKRLQASPHNTVTSTFSSPKWISVSNPIITNSLDMNDTYTKVKATNINREKSFLFAKDDMGKEYFIHFKRISNLTEDTTFRIVENDTFSVKPSDEPHSDKRIFVEKAWFVSQ